VECDIVLMLDLGIQKTEMGRLESEEMWVDRKTNKWARSKVSMPMSHTKMA